MRTIKAYVGASILDVSDRLFQGDVYSIVTELAQNSRRSGATTLTVSKAVNSIPTRPGKFIYTVEDNGSGIVDPAILLGMRDSAWENPEVANEDPAGMGFFVLAGRPWSSVRSLDWCVDKLTPDVFTGRLEAEVKPADMPLAGTEVRFASDEDCHEYRLQNFLGLCGMNAWLFGKQVSRTDFLAKVDRCMSIKQVVELPEFGVVVCMSGTTMGQGTSKVEFNMHGFCGTFDLASVTGKPESGLGLKFLVDIRNTKCLKLVLPARKSLVHNDQLLRLCEHLDEMACKTFACLSHTLTYAAYQHAKSYAPHIRPAHAGLLRLGVRETWSYSFASHKDMTPVGMESCAVLASNGELHRKFASVWYDWCDSKELPGEFGALDVMMPRDAYKGYEWYDMLPRCYLWQVYDNKIIADSPPTPDQLKAIGNRFVVLEDEEELPETAALLVLALIEYPDKTRRVFETRNVPAVYHWKTAKLNEDYSYMRDALIVSNEYTAASVAEFVDAAFRPTEFREYTEKEWFNEMLADVQQRVDSEAAAQGTVFSRLLSHMPDAVRDASVGSVEIDECLVELSRGLTPSRWVGDWKGRWRANFSDMRKPSVRRVELVRTVTSKLIVETPEAMTAEAAVRYALELTAPEGWSEGVVSVEAYDADTEWREI